MKKSLLKIALPILLVLPFVVILHLLGTSDASDSRIFLGAVLAPLAFMIFGYFLIQGNRKILQQQERLKSILEATSEAIYGVDMEGSCTFANKRCLEILGYTREEDLIGKDMHALTHHTLLEGADNDKECCEIFQAILEGKEAHSDNVLFWKSDGTSFTADYRLNPLILNGEIHGAVITFSDVTEKKLTEERIRYLTYHDASTGLYNQTFFYEELERIDTEENQPLSLIMGDVNNLKLANDIYGHETGDALLRGISRAILRCSRHWDLVSRMGGDEFVMLLPRTNEEQANQIMNKVLKEVAKVQVYSLKGSISLGKATKNNLLEDMVGLLKLAESEMYKQKSLSQEKNNIEQLHQIMDNLHTKSEREKEHSQNVAMICEKIALQMNLTSEEVRRIRNAGYYHDIGKTVLSEEILNKEGRLVDKELIEKKRHTVVGYRILNLFDETLDIAIGALDHHERWDGSGYPKGLKKEEISLQGRIIAVAEIYDAKTSSYNPERLTKEDATLEIKENAGVKYDPQVVEAFLAIIQSF